MEEGEVAFAKRKPFHSANPEFRPNNYVPAFFDSPLFAGWLSFVLCAIICLGCKRVGGEGERVFGERATVELINVVSTTVVEIKFCARNAQTNGFVASSFYLFVDNDDAVLD